MKRVEAMLSDEKVSRLSEWARAHGVTRSEVLVALVSGLLEGEINLGLEDYQVTMSRLRVSSRVRNGSRKRSVPRKNKSK